MSERLEQTISEHGTFVRAVVRAILSDESAADDAVQETWIRGLREPAERSRARLWLATVARNVGRNFLRDEARRRARERAAAATEPLPSTVERVTRHEVVLSVAAAVAALPEPYRDAILLRYYDDLPPREIAARLGVPVATVKSRIQRGVDRVRHRLRAERPDGLASVVLFDSSAGTPGALPNALPNATFGGTVLASKISVAAVVAILAAIGWILLRGVGDEPSRVDEARAPAGSTEVEGRPVDSRRAAAAPDERVAVTPSAAPSDESSAAPRNDVRVRLEGRVLDAVGDPLDGAVVELVRATGAPSTSAGERTSLRVATDAAGRFVVPGAPPGAARVSVTRAGFAPILSAPLHVPPVESYRLNDLVMASGAILRGVVVDDRGVGVAGARIVVGERPGGIVEHAFLREVAVSASDGSFVADELALGHSTLGVVADGFVPQRVERRVGDAGPARDGGGEEPMRVELESGWSFTAEIRGAPGGAELALAIDPSSGSRLAADEFDWLLHRRRVAPIGASRVVSFGGIPSGERFRLQLEERAPGGTGRDCAVVTAVAEDASRVTIHYVATASVSVRAFDEHGRVVDDYVLRALDVDSGDEAELALVEVRPDGSRRFRIDEPGRYRLRLLASGFAEAGLGPIELDGGTERDLADVRLSMGRRLDLLVVDARDGSAVADAGISAAAVAGDRIVAPSEDPVLRPAARRTRTDASGRATVMLPGAAQAEVTVAHPGYAHRAILVDAGDSIERTIALVPAGMLIVRTRDDADALVVGVRVVVEALEDASWSPLSATSDHEGKVVFSNVPPGPFRVSGREENALARRTLLGGVAALVTISTDGVAAGEAAPAVETRVEAGGATEVTLHVPRRVSLGGAVVAGGSAVPGATLLLVPGAVDVSVFTTFGVTGGVETTTDGFGRFRFDGVREGKATLVVRHASLALPAVFALELARVENEFVARLPRTGIRGVVHAADGSPVADARVFVHPVADGGMTLSRPRILTASPDGELSMDLGDPEGASATSDVEGRFELDGLPAGVSLRVDVRGRFFAPNRRTVRLRDGEVLQHDVTLNEAGELVVVLTRPSGAPGRHGHVTLEREGTGTGERHERFTGASDRATFPSLEPGPWRVTVMAFGSAGDPPAPRSVIVRATESATTVIVIGEEDRG